MRRALTMLCFAFLVASQAQADTQAHIVSLEPVNHTTLVANEPFYVRVEYATDQPVNLWAHPYFRGKPVKTMLAGTSSRYMGKGEVVGWFTLTEPGKVDEIRIVVGGGEPWRQWQVARRRLDLQWVAAPPLVSQTQ
jgi:hypothetical protein